MRALPMVLLSMTLVAGAACADPGSQRLVPRDKLLHLGLSAALGAAAAQAARNHGMNDCEAARAAIGVTLVIGAAKEYRDGRPGGSGWSWSDMAWNLLGGTLGSLAVSGCH